MFINHTVDLLVVGEAVVVITVGSKDGFVVTDAGVVMAADAVACWKRSLFFFVEDLQPVKSGFGYYW